MLKHCSIAIIKEFVLEAYQHLPLYLPLCKAELENNIMKPKGKIKSIWGTWSKTYGIQGRTSERKQKEIMGMAIKEVVLLISNYKLIGSNFTKQWKEGYSKTIR